MKKNKLILLLGIAFGLFSCVKNDPVIFNDSLVEFDATVYNPNTAYMVPPDSIAFAMLTRRPATGRQVNSSDPLLTRASGAVSLRVNLVGAPRNAPTTINYRIANKNEYALLGVAANMNAQATPGTHFTALPGNLTIPADSSFGFINVGILNPGTPDSIARELVLVLTESGDVKPSRNYKVAGLRISQL